MPYVSPSTHATSDVILSPASSSGWNQDVVANMQAMAPDMFTAAGDIEYGTSAKGSTRLPIGTSGQLFMVSTALLPAWKTPYFIDRDVTETIYTGTATAEATLYSFTVPANTLTSNNALRLVALMELNNQGFSGRMSIRLGGSTLYFNDVVGGATGPSAARLEMVLSGAGAPTAHVAATLFNTHNTTGSAATAPSATAQSDVAVNILDKIAVHTGCTENMATDQTLAIAASWVASNASARINLYDVQLDAI